MNRHSAFAVAFAASATAVLGLSAVPASAISLGDLLEPGATFQDEDKLFSNFTFQVACLDFSNPAAKCEDLFAAGHIRPISPFQIGVGPATTKHGPGIQFNDFFRANDGYGIDLAITYDVEVVDSPQLISDLHLSFDAVLDSGRVEIIETAFDTDDNVVGQLFADNITGNGVPDLVDWAVFDMPVKKLRVVKDINLTSVRGTGSSIMTTIDQEFSQCVPGDSGKCDVPEPGTIGGLLAIGSFGIGAMLKRHRQEKNKIDL